MLSSSCFDFHTPKYHLYNLRGIYNERCSFPKFCLSLFYKNVTDHETVLQFDPKLSESVVLACGLSLIILYMLFSSLLLALSMRSGEIIMKLLFSCICTCMKYKYIDNNVYMSFCIFMYIYISLKISS